MFFGGLKKLTYTHLRIVTEIFKKDIEPNVKRIMTHEGWVFRVCKKVASIGVV
ncbi:hypothetical protein Hanom_Chr06g00505841 [Helianthus anomalus]